MTAIDPAQIDVADLNTSAAALYEVAFARGSYAGRQETISQLADRHARALLELLDPILRAALASTGDDRTFLVSLARLVLGRTPMVVSAVNRSLILLGGRRGDEPDDGDIHEALELVRQAIPELPQ